MKIGSESSIFGLFMPKTRKAPSMADEKIDFKAVPSPKTQAKSDEQILADHYDRAAQQLLDYADADNDGFLSKDEYMGAQKRMADTDKRPFDLHTIEGFWTKLDPNGKGAIDKAEVVEGLRASLPLNIGHLDPSTADAIRNRPPTVS
jgi:hypothetical protein